MELQVCRNCNKGTIAYTKAKPEDLALITELIGEFKSEFDGMLFSEEDLVACPQSPGNPLCHLRESLLSRDSLVLMAKSENKAVAFLKFDRGQSSKSRHRGVFTMAVKEAFWGYGIGTALLRNLENWAIEHEILRLELNVLETNRRAIKLYEKEGYVFEGHKECAALVNGRYVGGYWMAKILGKALCNEKL
jgi:ribosomal protein S18 acetylase RimI-like enzyme